MSPGSNPDAREPLPAKAHRKFPVPICGRYVEFCLGKLSESKTDNIYTRRPIKTVLAFTDSPSKYVEQNLQHLSNPANPLQNSDPPHIDWPLAGILVNYNL